jgi:tRNA nucleotidyltransferase (CCA-adding enzyme)
MNVILTHEQSDFDALGATLGAWLLEDSSRPLLAVRLNRNVRHFINVYGTELPFIESRDLPPEPIEKVTLVDTQSLVTLKGITQSTRVRVIDHHPRRKDLPADWQVELEKTGACTTLFVERLAEQLTRLTMIQATLLLLGIYEDTGAMTYSLTTPRDVRACASLLEAGASLRIAAEYLNPALTDAQKSLADRLLTTAHTLTLQGKLIIIATGDARDMREEISSVAHKLRDLLDPDGLFLLVQTSEGIRLVARSTSDQVNVANIARHFGGGGHDRAASALIDARKLHTPEKELTPEDIAAELIEILQTEIHPAVTVGKIMSKQPFLLTPETTLYEAQRVMQRYGYEGFPVVDAGKVVGLLTRRAVDRASAHHLNLTAGSLMEAGSYSLLPGDPIDRLQSLMATTGWGQIPVIDPQTEMVIGIVTRTDFLKTLPRENNFVPGKLNYADLLEKALPPQRLCLIRQVAEEAAHEKTPIYIVGGFVRDLILDRPSIDFDIVVEGDAIALANRLMRRFGGRVTSHKRFGTAKWMVKANKPAFAAALGLAPDQADYLPDSLDLISARTEFYDHPSALPTVERSSIKLDLHRRDFTINTMALRLDGHHFGELYDYWDGLNDLHKKQVKVLHSLSFVDDPTRMLRAVRFEQRFHFHIEDRTLQLIEEGKPLLKQVSGDRLRHEFNLIFKEDQPFPILLRLQELGLLSALQPDLKIPAELEPALLQAFALLGSEQWNFAANVDHLSLRQAVSYLVWLIPQGERVASETCQRLHVSNELYEALGKGTKVWQDHLRLIDQPNSAFADALQGCPRVSGYALWLLAQNSQFKEKLVRYFTHWSILMPFTDGNKLKEMGLPTGPQYSEILHTLRNAWIDEKIQSQEEEAALLQKLTSS